MRELEQIIALIQGLGDATMQGFIWYLVATTVRYLIGYAVGVVLIATIYKIACKIISAVSEANESELLKTEIRSALNDITGLGYHIGYDPSRREIVNTLEKMGKHVVALKEEVRGVQQQ